MNNTNITEQSWTALWNRPGGTFAKITAVGVFAAVIYGFMKALPFLVAAAANTLLLIVELVAIVAILSILTSKNFWKWIGLFWLQLNRKVVSWFVRIDPIAILENGIAELNEKLKIVRQNVKDLGGVLVGMKNKLEEYQKDFDDEVNGRKAIERILTDPNLTSEEGLEFKSKLVLSNKKIARLDTLIAKQKQRIVTSEKYLQVMKKLEVVANFKVEDSKNELDVRKEEYTQAIKQQTAMKSITSILKGGMSKALEEELAIEYMSTTINNSIAEMNELLDGSNDLLADFDIETVTNAEKVDAILARYEQYGFDSFSNDDNPKSVSYNEVGTAISDMKTPEKVPVLMENKYFS